MKPEPSTPSGYREQNSTADKALQILGLFHDDRLVIGATDVAVALQTSRSTAYRYLQSLVSAGFLEEQAGGGFRLGSRVLELSRLARKGFRVVDASRPIMRGLRDSLGETVLLTRRSGDRVVCLETEEARSTVRISYERGSVVPLHAGAAALVLLAWMPVHDSQALLAASTRERFTDATLVEIESLMIRLGQIRKDGIATSRGELDPDVVGVAAPIRSHVGDVDAAISIAALSQRVPEQRLGEVSAAVRDAAADIERELRHI
jgi:DNA-binding IclR family transcriptional regulator